MATKIVDLPIENSLPEGSRGYYGCQPPIISKSFENPLCISRYSKYIPVTEIFQGHDITIPGWWYTHPSEKYES